MRYRYVYQRNGAPLLTWKGGPPHQTRAADAKALGGLGSLSEPTLAQPTIALPLPRPGSPEPVGGLGCGECGGGSRDIVVDVISPSFIAGAAVGYFLLTRLFKSS